MINTEKLCMGCMNDNDGEQICPICGYDSSHQNHAQCLPVKSEIKNRYILGKALAVNGEGITYIAWDKSTDSIVKVKEYFPLGAAVRNPDTSVSILQEKKYVFNEGLLEFLEINRKIMEQSLTAMLQVNDAELQAGAQAKFYLAVKPFEAKADSRLTVYVNGSEKTIRLSEDVSFEEGRIKTLNVPVKTLAYPITTMPELSSMFDLDSTCHVDSGYVNGVPVDGFLVLGDKDATGSVTLTGTVADFINMTEFGFFASSWTGNRSALTIKTINIETTFLGYEADYTMTCDQFASYVGMPSSLFVLRPYPAGQFDVSPGVHNVIILDEESHYYGVTERGVDFVLSFYGLSVEGLRRLINGEDNSYVEKLKPLVPDQLKAYFTEEMADMIIPGFRESTISIELSTMNQDNAGNKIDPRVAIWGMNVYYTGD